jgi:hypothetical protein
VNPLAWLRIGLLAAVLAGLAASHFMAFRSGKATVRAEWTAANLEQERLAAKETQRRIEKSAENQRIRDEELRAINALYADALERLRNRPERRAVQASNPTACAGASGAELSGPDAGFLAGEAARANVLRAALAACYRHVDQVVGP